jgi:hypothetical protein
MDPNGGAGVGAARGQAATVVVRPAGPAEVPVAPRVAPPAGGQPASSGRIAAAPRAPQARRRRRWPPAMVPMLAVVGVVAGAMVVAAFSSGDGLAVGPIATPTPVAPASSEAAATNVPSAEVTEPPTTEPTAVPTPEPTPVAPAETAELCDPILGLACSLGSGQYAALELSPGFDLEVGDGWSVAVSEPDLLALSRREGLITFVGGATQVFPEGRGEETRGRVRDLIRAWRSTEGVEATRARDVRIDDRRGQSVDVSATGRERIAVFGIDGNVYYLEPGRLTRLVALDAPGRESLIIVIEPDGRHTLEEILATADDVAASVRFT